MNKYTKKNGNPVADIASGSKQKTAVWLQLLPEQCSY